MFKDDVIKFNPDIIIIYEAVNDSFNIPLMKKNNFINKLHNFLYYKWMLYTICLEKYLIWKNQSPTPFSQERVLSEDFIKYLENIIILARQNNIKVVLVRQAISISEDNIKDNCSLSELKKMYDDKENTGYKRRIIAHYYYAKQMEYLGEKYGLMIIDPIKNLIAQPDLFIDGIHLSGEGNRFLAEMIAQEIRKMRIKDD